MSDMLLSAAGKVAALDIKDALPAIVKVEGLNDSGSSDVVLIQSISYDQKTNQQFQTSLDKAVYIYVFGDHMGSITVSGIVFTSSCSSKDNGLAALVKFYNDNRAAKRSTPVSFSAGADVRASGFVTDFQIRSQSESKEFSGLIYGYSMTISTLPEA